MYNTLTKWLNIYVTYTVLYSNIKYISIRRVWAEVKRLFMC